MKNVTFSCALVLLLLCNTAQSALGHHSMARYTGAEGSISITGVVKKFELTNPHSYIYLEVTGQDGKTKLWAVEMQSLSHLTTLGWTGTTVKAGETLVIAGNPARNGAPAMYGQAIKLSDGRMIRS